jgi:hypothetical protein
MMKMNMSIHHEKAIEKAAEEDVTKITTMLNILIYKLMKST